MEESLEGTEYPCYKVCNDECGSEVGPQGRVGTESRKREVSVDYTIVCRI